jgi:hypothetical protein
VLVGAGSNAVEQHGAIDARVRLRIYLGGAVAVLVLGALAPAPWLLALLTVGVLSVTWLLSFVPPTPAGSPEA